MKPLVLQEIREIIADDTRVLTEAHDLYSYSFDASFGDYLPDVVVQPRSKEQIAALMQLANREEIPVTPRGQATSLCGGPLPVRAGMVLDLSGMNEKLEIDCENLVATVSPGVLTATIHDAAEANGLMYPPDPSSSHVSTIGGNLAMNSGGPRGLKYGVTKDYVLGLEVVTPEGKIIRTGGWTVKNVTGYDLTKLIVGSEGTLAIITEAILRLIPKPPATETLMAVFDDLVESGHAISRMLSSGIVPAKMEMMDQAAVVAVENYKPTGLPVAAAAIVLIEVDGHVAAVKDEIRQAAAICRQWGASEVQVAKTPEQRAALWFGRKHVSPAIATIKPTKIAEDITVPRTKIPDMFARLQHIRDRYNIHLVVFGHAGDGNLHPNIIADARDRSEMKRVEKAVSDIFAAAVELGGTLSGEHGIGTMKAPFMEMELGADGVDMMKRIKHAWDPRNVLNPSKIFPEPGQRLVLSE